MQSVKIIDSKTAARKRRLLIIIGCIWVVVFCAGGWFVLSRMNKTEIPDPQTADLDSLVAFTRSEDFLNMSTDQRSRFVTAMMDKQYRQVLEGGGGAGVIEKLNIRGAMYGDRKAMSLWKTFGKDRADEIYKLPAPQASQMIDKYITMVEIIGGKDTVRDLTQETQHLADQTPVNQFIRGGVEMSRGTTAEQRARMSSVGAMALWKVRSKYGVK